MSSTRLKFFYFDLGNVLLLFDHRRAAEQMAVVAEVSVEAAWAAVFESDLEWKFESGELDPIGFYNHFCHETGSSPDIDRLLFASADIFSLNEPVVPIVAALQSAGHPLGILSNTNTVHWNFVYAGRYQVVLNHFTHFALSFEIGTMKPLASIYEAASRIAGVQAEEVFFVDDRPENVQGALRCGFDAVLFTTADQLARDLAARGFSTAQ